MGNCFASKISHSEANSDSESSSINLSYSTKHSTRATGSSAAAISDAPFSPGEILSAPKLKIYSFADLKNATRNFNSHMVLGVGGFGTVYKGWVNKKTLAPTKVGTGMVVAIKKWNSECMQGYEAWKSEVDILGRFSHPNLVKLLGYCWEDKKLLLVYEFMQKGSLENHLFRRSPVAEPLSWDTQIRIAIGAAKGLAFLHTSKKQVIYRYFKASSILLNWDYGAKISDFRLTTQGPSVGMLYVTTCVVGTQGYAAPEYMATGHLHVKSDVYGFGVVLLEMLTGLRALDARRPSGQLSLVDWRRPYLYQKEKLKSNMDPRLEGQYSLEAALQAAQLTLRCLEPEPINRPSMKEVVEVLEHIDAMKVKPKESRIRSSGSSSQQLSIHRQSSYHSGDNSSGSDAGRYQRHSA